MRPSLSGSSPQFLVVSSRLDTGVSAGSRLASQERGSTAPAGGLSNSAADFEPWRLDLGPGMDISGRANASRGASRGQAAEGLRFATGAYADKRRRNIYSRESTSRTGSQQTKRREQPPASSLLAKSPYGAAVRGSGPRPGPRPSSRPSTQGPLHSTAGTARVSRTNDTSSQRPSTQGSFSSANLTRAETRATHRPYGSDADTQSAPSDLRRWQHSQSSLAGSRVRAQAQREAQVTQARQIPVMCSCAGCTDCAGGTLVAGQSTASSPN
jgi:hypothetical protein